MKQEIKYESTKCIFLISGPNHLQFAKFHIQGNIPIGNSFEKFKMRQSIDSEGLDCPIRTISNCICNKTMGLMN